MIEPEREGRGKHAVIRGSILMCSFRKIDLDREKKEIRERVMGEGKAIKMAC